MSMFKRFRSAVTGRYVTPAEAEASPAETVAEDLNKRLIYHRALVEIASRPTVERNPDGVDQAAYTMQLIAKEALGWAEVPR